MIFAARWSNIEVQFSVVILAQSEKLTDVREGVMASTTSTKTLMDGVSRLRVSFAAVKIFGSMVTSIQVEETNKRRKTEMVARSEAMVPSGGVGGAETSWQQIMGVDRNVEWQVALGEATDKEKSWGRMDEGFSMACETIFDLTKDWKEVEWDRVPAEKPQAEGAELGWPAYSVVFFNPKAIYQFSKWNGKARPVRRITVTAGGGLVNGSQELEIIDINAEDKKDAAEKAYRSELATYARQLIMAAAKPDAGDEKGTRSDLSAVPSQVDAATTRPPSVIIVEDVQAAAARESAVQPSLTQMMEDIMDDTMEG